MNEGPAQDPSWLETLASLALNRYPRGNELESALARTLGCEPENLLITAGGDEAIDRCCRAYLGPDRAAVVATPTFEMIPRYARLAGAGAIEIPWADNDAYPALATIDAARTSNARLIALVTPNNPTGRAIDRAAIERVVDATDTPVMLDLAYEEFGDDRLTDLALTSDRVVAIRTFSKAWGLAGLRVGYAVGTAESIAELRAAGGPFSVSAASRAIVETALRTGRDRLQQTIAAVLRSRAALHELMDSFGIRRTDSRANFVFFRHASAEAVWRALLERGILIRRWNEHPVLNDALRITCPADDTQTSELMRALSETLEENPDEPR
ncbi:MAG: histidinol-phosphate transaminase [Planctomycetota bacterium]